MIVSISQHSILCFITEQPTVKLKRKLVELWSSLLVARWSSVVAVRRSFNCILCTCKRTHLDALTHVSNA